MIQGPKFKICRRLGPGVHEKCQTQRFVLSVARRGKQKLGAKKPKALSDFGLQLIEKQKIRFSYGISEKQFSNYVKSSTTEKESSPSEALFEKLESRLDNVIYRLGIAHTRPLARQIVSHGHVVVNGKKLNIPSYQVKNGDVISIREGSKSSALFTELDKRLKNYNTPEWLASDMVKMEAKVTGAPKIQEANSFNTVFEFYSR